MTVLPTALKVWAEPLALLAEDLRPDVAQMAGRLDRLIGQLRPRDTERGGEPDGFRGLVRRGPYDRLLLSEWALLDEAPDEFVRRAVAGEHAFYQLETRKPSGGLHVRVVLDAGPSQLGGPRLVHIAALIVLHRRAQLAKATMTWSVAQRPQAVFETVDEPSLRGLLASRCHDPFVLPDLSGEPPADETWVIGPAPSAPDGGRTGGARAGHWLTLTDLIGPDTDAILATVHRPGARPSEAVLPLPAPPLRSKLLLTPFASRPVTAAPRPAHRPTPLAPRKSPEWRAFPEGVAGPLETRFVHGTAQFMCAFQSRHVLAWSFANVPRRAVPKAKIAQPANRVAMGWHHQGFLPVALDGGRVSSSAPRALSHAVSAGESPPPLGFGRAIAYANEVWFTDANEALWHLQRDALTLCGGGAWPSGAPRAGVIDLAPTPQGPLALERSGDGFRVLRLLPGGKIDVAAGFPGASRGSFWLQAGQIEPDVLLQERDVWSLRRPLTQVPVELLEADERWEILGIRRTYDWEPRTWSTTTLKWSRGGVGFALDQGLIGFEVPRRPIRPTASADLQFVGFHTLENTVEVWDVKRGEPVMLREVAT